MKDKIQTKFKECQADLEQRVISQMRDLSKQKDALESIVNNVILKQMQTQKENLEEVRVLKAEIMKLDQCKEDI